EVSGTAIEMNAVVTVRVDVRKGRAALGFRLPEIEGKKIPGLLKKLEPNRFLATTGIPLKPSGNRTPQEFTDGTLASLSNVAEDVTLAARDALLNMIDLLTGPRSPAPTRLSPEQAYIIYCRAWRWTFGSATWSTSPTSSSPRFSRSMFSKVGRTTTTRGSAASSRPSGQGRRATLSALLLPVSGETD